MTDDELYAELRRRHPATASGLADMLGLGRTDVDQALRRLVAAGRAELTGTVAIPTRREYVGEGVFEARPLHLE